MWEVIKIVFLVLACWLLASVPFALLLGAAIRLGQRGPREAA